MWLSSQTSPATNTFLKLVNPVFLSAFILFPLERFSLPIAAY